MKDSPSSNVLIAGCGLVGCALAELLKSHGHRVWGIRRRASELPSFLEPISVDLLETDRLGAQLPTDLDFVYYLASSDRKDRSSYERAYVEGLRNLLEALEKTAQNLHRVFFASSTSVYGQTTGEWVTEESVTQPVDYSGQIILRGEAVLASGPFPGTNVRFGGIYGPSRIRILKKLIRGEQRCGKEEPLFTNRIHVEDCAGVLFHLLSLPEPEELYLAVDHEPVDRCLLLNWLAQRLGVPPPDRSSRSGTGLRRRRGNKRCCNRRLVKTGYRFRYPTFREGYAQILQGISRERTLERPAENSNR